MAEKILYFDYCSIVITIILIITTILRKMVKTRAQKAYMSLLLLGLLLVVLDTAAALLDRNAAVPNAYKYLLHSLYLLFQSISIPVYMLYLLILSDTDHKMRGKRQFLFSLPFLLVFTVLATNPLHKSVFYMSPEGHYVKGTFFIVVYINFLIYYVMGVNHIVKYYKEYGRDQVLALFSLFPLMLAAMVMQYFYPRYLLEMFANTIALLLISCLLEKPEDYLDIDTELGRKSAYMDTQRRALVNGKHTAVIMLNIINFSSLRNMLGYEGMSELLKNLAEDLEKINHTYHFKGELFYLEEGKFRLVLDYRHLDLAEEAAEAVYQRMQEEFRYGGMEVSLRTVVCLTRCPEDIDHVGALMAFGNDLSDYKDEKQVVCARDIYQRKRYDIMQELDIIIEDALNNHKFEVYYQPIYSVEQKRFNSAEALLRLRNEKFGFVPPDILISAAEKSGAIHQIGSFVIEEVCRFICSDEFQGLGVDYIEINLSVA